MAQIPTPSNVETLPCPQCGGRMALRKNKVSQESFFGCMNYPKCTGTRTGQGLPSVISAVSLTRIQRILKAAVLASEDECLTFNEGDLRDVDQYELNIEAMIEDQGYVVTVIPKK